MDLKIKFAAQKRSGVLFRLHKISLIKRHALFLNFDNQLAKEFDMENLFHSLVQLRRLNLKRQYQMYEK